MVGIDAIPPGTVGRRLAGLLEARWLRSVGRYSFAMYVFHLPILMACGHAIRDAVAFTGSAAPLSYAVVVIVLSYLAGMVSFHLLEKHFLRLKPVLA
jgi:peptidoglycan/LPS O-acetylase OafA/YrhL